MVLSLNLIDSSSHSLLSLPRYARHTWIYKYLSFQGYITFLDTFSKFSFNILYRSCVLTFSITKVHFDTLASVILIIITWYVCLSSLITFHTATLVTFVSISLFASSESLRAILDSELSWTKGYLGLRAILDSRLLWVMAILDSSRLGFLSLSFQRCILDI